MKPNIVYEFIVVTILAIIIATSSAFSKTRWHSGIFSEHSSLDILSTIFLLSFLIGGIALVSSQFLFFFGLSSCNCPSGLFFIAARFLPVPRLCYSKDKERIIFNRQGRDDR
mgnify:CR=1 FL=1